MSDLGKDGLHTMAQLRLYIQIFLEKDVIAPQELRDVLIMELLLRIHDRLEGIESDISSMSSDSTDAWNERHNK